MSLIISSEFPNSDLLNLPYSFSVIPKSARKSKEYLNSEKNEVMEGLSGGVASEVTDRLGRNVYESQTLPHAFEYLGKSDISSPITFNLNSVDNIIVPFSSFEQVYLRCFVQFLCRIPTESQLSIVDVKQQFKQTN